MKEAKVEGDETYHKKSDLKITWKGKQLLRIKKEHIKSETKVDENKVE